MQRPRITVTQDELLTWFIVQLRLLPEGVWRKNEEEERKRAEKRWTSGEFPDPKVELAKYLAGKFAKAGWEASYLRPLSAAEAECGVGPVENEE
jgi:hypothetical protein